MMGIGTIAKKVFGTPNDRKVKATRPLVAAINELEPQFQALDDAGIRAKTTEFRERFAKGETLDELLPEAFANAREAARRTLGLRPFDVQLMGGIFLHQGNIAEMKTGEGKTLVATMPAYLNALTGRGVHVVTVNDYLARRDADWMGMVYHALGLSVGVVVPGMEEATKKTAYDADITYATNNELGFDYLRDNMKSDLAQVLQRDHYFAIVDEVELDPRGRGAHAADHLGAEPGPLRALHPDRQADPQARPGALRPRREAALDHADRGRQRVRRAPAARDGAARAGRHPLRPREHQHRSPRQPGAAGARPLPQGQGLYRAQRRGHADRRVHRPDDDRPAPLRRVAPGDRGQGGRGDPAGERDPGVGDFPELLPPLREARRHDRHRRHRSRRVRRDLQARGGRGADQHAGDPRGPRRPGLPHRPREVRRHRRGDRAGQQGRPADPRWHHLDREVREPLRDAQAGEGSTQRAQRPLPRAGGRHHRRGGRAGRGDHRHQHGRARHRHPARRQCRDAGHAGSRGSRAGRRARRSSRFAPAGGDRDRRRKGQGVAGGRALRPGHRAPREPAHRQPAPRPFRPAGRPGPHQLLPEPRGRPDADLRFRAARTRCWASSG